jgi:hypothetical protein
LPPFEATPRISNSVIPGPLVRIDTPGTVCMRDARSVKPRLTISSPETAVMLMEVVSMVDSRFSAVTMISSSCPAWDDCCCCAAADPAHRPATAGIHTKQAIPLNLNIRLP